MNDTVIKVESVSKKYCHTVKHTMLYGASDLSRSFLGIDQHTETLRDGEFWALNDVSFELKKGESLGLIGSNGSGKSTILKMLNGILMPDKGSIKITGRVGALIEVGAGFHPMLTGRENIYVNGAILGMTKSEIERKFDEIVDFAGIGEAIDSPVKHYSSGMYVRLGFAVAVHCAPDILLVDEVLAVGDIEFQFKCLKKMEEFRRHGKNIVLVSHDIIVINKMCNRVVLLDNGVVEHDLNATESIDRYFTIIADKMAKKADKNFLHDAEVDKQKSKRIFFSNIKLCDTNGKELNVFDVGQTISIKTTVIANIKTDHPVFGGIVYSSDGVYLGGFNSLAMVDFINSADGIYEIEYQIGGLFLQGVYLLTLVIHDETGKIIYDLVDRSYRFIVKMDTNSLPFSGHVKTPCLWKYKKISIGGNTI